MNITLYTAPFIGALIGYCTNEMAVKMISRPYKPWYIGKWQVPGTPGLIPANIEKIAAELVNYATDNYLNPTEILPLSSAIATEANIYGAVSQAIDVIINELRNTTKLHNLAKDMAEAVSIVINKSIPQMTEKIINFNGDCTFLDQIIDNVAEVVIAKWNISPQMAEYITSKIMEKFLSSEHIRLAVIKFLTPDNIDTISHLIKKKTKGGLGFVLTFINTKNPLIQLKNSFEDEPEASCETIDNTLQSLKLNTIIAEWIMSFKPQDLTWSTINYIKRHFKKVLQSYLKEYHPALILPIIQEINIPDMAYDLIIKFDPDTISEELLHKIKMEITYFIQRYLSDQLVNLIHNILKKVDLQSIVVEKIRSFPVPVLDAIVQKVAKRELQTIVIMGGAIGFIVGCIQSVLSLI